MIDTPTIPRAIAAGITIAPAEADVSGTPLEQALAHALSALIFIELSLSADLESCQAICRATKALEARLAAERWNAYAKATTLRSQRNTFKRRHQCRGGRTDA